MKKILLLLSIAAAAAAACQPKEMAETTAFPAGEAHSIAITLSASQPGTRTFIEAGQGGWQPMWHKGDSLTVTYAVDGDYASQKGFGNVAEDGQHGSFQGTVELADGEHTIYAYYPRSMKDGRVDGKPQFKFVLPAEQKVTKLSTFDPDADLLVSTGTGITIADGKLADADPLDFQRIFAVAKVVIADNSGKLAGKAIKGVRIKASHNTLSGRATVDVSTGNIEAWEGKTSYNYAGVKYDGTDWTADGTTGAFVILNPGTLAKGTNLTAEVFTDDASIIASHTVTLESALELARNEIKTLKFTFVASDFASAENIHTWDFSQPEWQEALAATGSAGSDIATWDFTVNGLKVYASKKNKYNTTYIQWGGAADGTTRYLKFTATTAGTLTVWASNTGNSEASDRTVEVKSGSYVKALSGGVPSGGVPAELIFTDVPAGDVYVYAPVNGLRFYKLQFVGGISDGSVNPGQPEDPPAEGNGPWDFSTSAWQSYFATLGAASAELSNFDKTIEGLEVKADTWKYGDSYFQMAKAGSNQANFFKFTVAESGVVTVVASHTGTTLPATDRYCTVYNNGTTANVVASVSSKAPKTCSFNVTAGDVYVYTTSENVENGTGMRFYKISFTAGTSVDPENPVLPDEAQGELEIPAELKPATRNVDPTQMIGFAQAAGVTGGAGASSSNILHFNNGKALQTWLLARTKSEKNGDTHPVTIWLSGTFGPEDGRDFSEAHPWFDVKDVSNLSFYGTDDFVMDRIGIFLVRAKNIIIRNINFQQPKANNGADAVSMQECDGVWVDHCTFTSLNQTKDYEDGSTDVTHGSKNVTISWCHYIKTQKTALVGHSNSQSGDAAITVTFHHNWFDQSSSRHPRVRFGWAHVYNNLYDGCTTYGAGSAYGAKVLVEYNYFDAVQLPTDICTYPAKESNESNLQGSVAGYLFAGGDLLVNRPGKAKDPYPLTNLKYKSYNGETLATPLTYADFKPSYSYTVTPAADVPELVKANAGYGKLDGFASAPVAVNNGGVSEYNGTEEDPVDPDPGSGEDPGQAEGLSDGWSWVNNGATATYAVTDGKLSVSSTGKWESKAQTFGYAYREVTGDFTATVKLESYNPQKSGSNQAVAGLMLVNGDASATATNLLFGIVGNVYANSRIEAGKDKSGATLTAPSSTGGDTILRLVREGNKIKMSYSLDGGENYSSVSSKEFTVALPETVKIGVACNSGDNSKQSTAVFANFTVNDSAIAF